MSISASLLLLALLVPIATKINKIISSEPKIKSDLLFNEVEMNVLYFTVGVCAGIAFINTIFYLGVT